MYASIFPTAAPGLGNRWLLTCVWLAGRALGAGSKMYSTGDRRWRELWVCNWGACQARARVGSLWPDFRGVSESLCLPAVQRGCLHVLLLHGLSPALKARTPFPTGDQHRIINVPSGWSGPGNRCLRAASSCCGEHCQKVLWDPFEVPYPSRGDKMGSEALAQQPLPCGPLRNVGQADLHRPVPLGFAH